MAFVSRQRFLWRLRTRALALGQRTALMAIMNLTPDSFSGDGLLSPDGGTVRDQAVRSALRALDDGADILDFGAESTRPGAAPLSAAEEQDRLLPALEAVHSVRPDAVLSVDTYHAETARAAVAAGAEIINDVSGLEWDPMMAQAIADAGCGLVLMHTRGRPREWRQQQRLAPGEVLPAVFAGLCERLVLAEAAGIASNRIVLDPGFGFGKLGSENVELLTGFGRLAELGRPLLAGLSRKGFLAELGTTEGRASELSGYVQPSLAVMRRVPTIAANVAAVLAGAHLLRVHDVQDTREALCVADAVLADEQLVPESQLVL